MTYWRTLSSILFLFLCLSVYAQELPPIEKFTVKDYGGGNQNWMIAQDAEKYIYVANNVGLLIYNGAEWNTYLSPNNSILRAVKVVGHKIYTGCYAEFGYWEKDEFGTLQYTSLIPKLGENSFEDDQIWNILEYKDWILFQSGHELFFYHKNTEDFKVIASEKIIYKVFKVENQIYYHVANEGVYKIEDGAPQLMIDDSVVLQDRVINVFKNEADQLVLLTRNSGFYQFKNNQLVKWNIPANSTLAKLNIFNSIQLRNGKFVLGTISNGLFVINQNGEIEYSINQKKGLGNNTVLTLFEDIDGHVWAGLDNGVNCINVDSPIKTFIDYDGILGTVYATSVFQDFLYIGTNQGLFYRPLKSSSQDFKFVQGTAGQVWSLFNENNEHLLCGHHLGTFLIEGSNAKRISSILGAWNFKKIPQREHLILQGNYSGLYVLEKTNGKWQVKNKVEGFNNSSRFFEINEANQIWVNHEYKGVFGFQLDSLLTKAMEVKPHLELAKGKTSGLIFYRNKILYASEAGFFEYNPTKGRFIKDSLFNVLFFPKDYTSGKMVVDEKGKLWTFSKDNISYIDNDDLTNQLEIVHIPISPDLRSGVLGFENIELVKADKYVLGITNGYLMIDLSKKKTTKKHLIYLNEVSIKDLNENLTKLPLRQAGEFEYQQGILSFDYAVPEYDQFEDVKYQYRLVGQMERWSNWSDQSKIQFENLSFGDYSFEVRAKVGNELSENVVVYNFTINRPWYISNVAIAFYLLSLLGIVFLVHKAYKFYYERILKHKQIQNEKAIMQIQNEKLNQEIESKNSELAISTMSIIKKNELLGKIKKELKNNNIEGTIKLIDKNLGNNNDWKFFKEAFNNADKGFLDKIKKEHPDLTPNDLRFCAYLRLNLSSKEIAPLLNISTKSVETKRYRLRKKLNLNHDENLINYILKF